MGLIEIAGYYTNLKKGFDKLGVPCKFVDLSGHPFEYGKGEQKRAGFPLLRWLRRVTCSVVRSKVIQARLYGLLQTVVGVPLFLWNSWQYDVFIFGFGSSFLGHYDFPLLKAMGKKIICVFHGSDMRPSYMKGAEILGEGGLTTAQCIQQDHRRKRRLRRIERYADYTITIPGQAPFHEKPYVVYTIIGLPFSARDEDGQNDASVANTQAKAVRILHSPSNPIAKGTPLVREMIERLKAKGRKIAYEEITGRPHVEVLSAIRRCDFVVDELYSDTFLAGLATEAAFLGKPAVVGSYAGDEMRRVMPPEMIPPVEHCHPDKVEEAIDRLITDEARRLDLGRRAQEFVRTEYAPERVAERYLQLLSGKAPDSWFADPYDIRYVHGACLPEERRREEVRRVIEMGGVEALQLSDKPELERMFVEFAGLANPEKGSGT